MASLTVGIVGATGAVGQEMLRVLEKRRFPVREVVPLASSRSAGKTVSFAGKDVVVRELRRDAFRGLDLALFSAGASVSREMAPVAVAAGALVVDNSSAFRLEPGVPLVVPEVNLDAARRHEGIIANPNCSTIILVMALAPIQRLSRLERVVVSTYQAASGAGGRGMEALEQELRGEETTSSPFPHRLAGNLIPRIDTLQENGYTREEMKMVLETRKILGADGLSVSATCVRVPVARAHSEAVQVTTEKPLSLEEIRGSLGCAPGVRLLDRPADDVYPMPLEVSGEDDVFVGRLRVHPDDPRTYDLWVVGDQILKGAALNAVQIAEKVLAGEP
ncbi:MAG: aspartate-semialdehyde dehydrogenase [Planctomycetota bacterium]|nr:aspartate-semialdehyde dehydrogenase [Planctomycetota bacterium]